MWDGGGPGVPGIGRGVHLSAGGAEIDAAFIERVDGHRVAQDVHVAVSLREPLREGLPLVSARAAAVNAQLAIGWKVLPVALDGDDVDGLRLVGVHVDHESEVGGQVSADLLPRVAGVVAAHDVPVLLHEEDVWARRVHGYVVNEVTGIGYGIGVVFDMRSLAV